MKKILLFLFCATIAATPSFSQRFSINDSNTVFKNQEGKILTAEEVQTMMKGTFSIKKENHDGKQIVTIVPAAAGEQSGRILQMEIYKSKLRNTSLASFHFTDIKKEIVESGKLKGKVVVINFWFTSCGPCIKEMPFLNELVEDNKDKPVVFIAPAPENENQINKFLQKNNFKYHIIPSSLDYINTLKIENFPTHLVVDKDGIIREVFIGYSDDIRTKLQETIDMLLK